jgi:hypothetical protein
MTHARPQIVAFGHTRGLDALLRMQHAGAVLAIGLEVQDHLSHLCENVRVSTGARRLDARHPGAIEERLGHVVFERGDDPADDAACVFLDGHAALSQCM